MSHPCPAKLKYFFNPLINWSAISEDKWAIVLAQDTKFRVPTIVLETWRHKRNTGGE
jgi:hypothetical protein